MKFRLLASAAVFTLLSTTAMSASMVFEKADNQFETQACHAAASEGLNAAKDIIKANKVSYKHFRANVKCNGMTIDKFADKYATVQDPNQSIKVVALSAIDQTIESRLCLDAVTIGEKAARAKHDLPNANIMCNGKNITRFLKSFKDTKVVSNESKAIVTAKTE